MKRQTILIIFALLLFTLLVFTSPNATLTGYTIALDSNEVSIETGGSTSLTLEITNDETEEATITIQSSSTDLDCTLSTEEYTLAAEESTDLEVSIEDPGLELGEYECDITITGFEEEETTTITVSIEEKEKTISRELSLALENSKFAQDTNIEGAITIELEEDLIPDETLTVTIEEETWNFAIQDVLNNLNYTLEYDKLGFEALNAETEKELTFEGDNYNIIGIQVPRYSEIEDIEFSLVAGEYKSSYPSSAKIDIGNEGQTDWFYLGKFSSYSGEKLSSPDLDEESEGTGYILDDETYYCEIIDLPETKDVKISADYTKVGTAGDMQAILLSIPTGNPAYGYSGGSDTCDLAESSSSCEIKLSYPIKGEHLVCIYSTEMKTGSECKDNDDCEDGYTCNLKDDICEEVLFEIPLDTSEETKTAYTCPSGGDGYCDTASFSNFFIYADTAEYNDELKGKINLNKWETFTDAIITGIKYYVGSEPYSGICKTDTCNVPLNISSASAGIITLKDLSFTYTFNDVTQSSATFYDLKQAQTNITEVESQELKDGASIDIDLSVLELSLSELGDYTIEISFLEETDSAEFSIVSEDNIYDAESLINTAITNYETFSDESTDEYYIISMLDINQKVANSLDNLESLQTQIGFVDENDLLKNAEDILEGEVWKISFSQTETDTLTIEEDDIPSSLGDEEEIYSMQDFIEVAGTSRTVEVESYNGETITYYMVQKEITAIGDFDDATLYEVAPIDFEDLLYSSRPKSSDEEIGEFSLSLNAGSSKSYYYMNEEELDLTDFKTIIITEESIECTQDRDCDDGYICKDNECILEETVSYECGDNICTEAYEDSSSCSEDCKSSIPWAWIIVIFVIITLLALGIKFKDKLFKKKTKTITPTIPHKVPVTKAKPKPRRGGLDFSGK